jgi:DNA-binding NtrC family response regulator
VLPIPSNPGGTTSEMAEKPKVTVYVVDDEEVICSTLAAILEMSGFHALAFTSPLKALQAAESEVPDLLITDVNMPDMNGIDFAIQVESGFPSCKILLFTGYGNTFRLLEDARRQGHDFNILSKPVSPRELLAAMRRL